MSFLSKNISIHPKMAAVVDATVSAIMIFWLISSKGAGSWLAVGIWFFLRLALWGVLMGLMYYPAELRRWRHFFSLSIFCLGILSFLLFMEWQPALYLFAIIFIFFDFISFWILPASNVGMSVFIKPHLRWRFMMAIIGLAGILELAGAVVSFQILYTVNNLVWIILAALICALSAAWWWHEYGIVGNKRFVIFTTIMFLLMGELIWVIEMLSIGYLSGSFILIWCWYILWLLVRFNLTSEGINWKKQTVFLSINAVLFIIFLSFIIKWK